MEMLRSLYGQEMQVNGQYVPFRPAYFNGQPYMQPPYGMMHQQPYVPPQQMGYMPPQQPYSPPFNPYAVQQQMPPFQSRPPAAPAYKQQNMFENPLQPVKAPAQNPYSPPNNPYPKQANLQKSQPAGISSVLNQFKTQDGSIDINKMMSTAGQMMNTMNQVSSMVKGVGSIFKVTG